MKWIAYVIAWLAATLFWTLASASSAGRSPLDTLPFAVLAMGPAAAMGLAVWSLTGRVAWDWRAPSFYGVHAAAIAAYTAIYSTSWLWPDLVRGHIRIALDALRSSPILPWNMLMGSWLYLIVAGVSYAVRARRQVRDHEAAAAEARLLAQEAQLAALRAQLNPHFLFNALHSVGALVTSDPAHADLALECLGDLLRYALGADNSVLFAQEWKFTGDYLTFERLRLGDLLRVDAHADPAAFSIMVPPLLLQPLVENAVRHGIADRPDGGRIELRAVVQEKRLVLRVTDDGRGDPLGAREGLGLTSVRRRLAALYGDYATLGITNSTTGFTVTIGLPAANDPGSAG